MSNNQAPKPQAEATIQHAQGLIQSMQIAFQQVSSLLNRYGIDMYMYKVKLYLKESEQGIAIDEDCPNARLCIDYIVRIKCENDYICMKLKESIKAQAEMQ
jgi:hypothetical protein